MNTMTFSYTRKKTRSTFDEDEEEDQTIEDFLASLFSESDKLPVVFDPQTDKMIDEYLKSFVALYGLISAQQGLPNDSWPKIHQLIKNDSTNTFKINSMK